MHDDDSSQALTRRRFLRLSATGAALSTAGRGPGHRRRRRRPAGDHVRRADRRRRARSRRRVVPHRPAGAAAGPLRHDRRAGWRARARVGADVGRGRLHRAARSDRPAAGPAHRLRGALRGPGRRAQRAGARRVPDAGADAGAGPDRLGRRRLRARAGASTKARGGMRTFASMRARRAGPVHPLRRRDLRRRADPGDAAPRRRLDVEQPRRGRRRRGRPDARPSSAAATATTCATTHLRAFNAEVPMVAQWDDHEVLNNWYPTEVLGAAGNDARYTEKQRRRARRARASRRSSTTPRSAASARDPRQVYRVVRRGPLAEVFVLDCRSYRGPNTRQPPAAARPGRPRMLAATQLRLARGGAGALDRDVEDHRLRSADRRGRAGRPAAGRLRQRRPADARPRARDRGAARGAQAPRASATCLFVTADVHYAAAHRYDPARATYTDFDPFWEFVAGPLHAGTFGPGALDATFGPEAVFTSVAPKPNRPAERRAAVLRARGDRSGDARRDGDAASSAQAITRRSTAEG